MIKFAIQQWDKNKGKLEEYYKDYIEDNFNEAINYFDGNLSYEEVVKNLVKYVYNDSELNEDEFEYIENVFDYENITEVDNGDYQGTLLYLIPVRTYQPEESDYLMTYAGYGSCSGCDTLERIFSDEKDEMVDGLMELSLHLVQNTIKPYNNGWRNNELFENKE